MEIKGAGVEIGRLHGFTRAGRIIEKFIFCTIVRNTLVLTDVQVLRAVTTALIRNAILAYQSTIAKTFGGVRGHWYQTWFTVTFE